MSAPSAPPFRIKVVPVTPFQQNCSILVDAATGLGAVVDPGGDVDRIEAEIDDLGCRIEKILITHGHLDHAGGATELKRRLELKQATAVPIEGPQRADAALLARIGETAAGYGLAGMGPMVPDRWLEAGDAVTVGARHFDVLHCPGHSPGSIVFVDRDAGFAFMGDVLFQGSIGRTDIPGGDHAQLLRSIRDFVLPLGDDVVFLPGHGGMSGIGEERRSNPFLR